MECLGIDVSKNTLSCARGQVVHEFTNDEPGLNELLKFSRGATTWCMEATGRYHQRVALLGWQQGIRCLVVNPGKAKKYLEFVSARGKNDAMDAKALARLAEKEGENLRAHVPVPEVVALARDAMVRRRAVIASRVALEAVVSQTGDSGGEMQRAIQSLREAEKSLLTQAQVAMKGYPGYEHLRSIPGYGPISSLLLVCALERGEFLTPDSIVAFAGLDPRVRDSGKMKGRRALSHQGDAELRTALFMAARAGARLPEWQEYYERQREKGLSTTAATAILARKLLRVGWKVYRQGAPFVSQRTEPLDNET